MPTWWAIIQGLTTLLLLGESSPVSKANSKIDTQVVLPVLLKELDHIQAIIGRYDTFFFLMKQLCLGSVFAVLGVYLRKPFDGLGFLIIVPIVFYVFEFTFRCSFWSAFIFRVLEIERFLNGKCTTMRLYCLNDQRPLWSRARLAFKPFDVIFYLIMAVVIWISTHFFGGNPWRFAVHNS